MAQIDASIPLQVKPFEAPNMLAQYANVAQIQGVQQRNKLYDLQLSEAERAQQEKQALGQAWRDNVGADGTVNRAGLTGSLAQGGYGSAIPGLQKTFNDTDKSAVDLKKSQTEQALQAFDFTERLMAGVRDQPSYDLARQQMAQQFGPEAAARLPAAYNPATIEQAKLQAMPVKDRLAAELARMNAEEAARHNQATESTARENTGIARGHLGVSQGNLSVAQQRLNLEKDAPKGQIVQGPDGPVLVDPRTGRATSVTDTAGAPLGSTKVAAEMSARTRDAGEVLALLNQATPLIEGRAATPGSPAVPSATGSILGNAYDSAAGAFGNSPPGAQSAAQLKALGGALIAKMPKMSGPQSDKDVQLYREMAGQIGDPTVPRAAKLAAMKTIREINERSAGIAPKTKPNNSVPSNIDSLLDKYK